MPWVVVGYASGSVLVNPVKDLNVNRYISHYISQSLRNLVIFVFPFTPPPLPHPVIVVGVVVCVRSDSLSSSYCGRSSGLCA